MEIFKTAKVTVDFMVTIVAVYIKKQQNAHQKIPIRFWEKSRICLKIILEKHSGGGRICPIPPPPAK